MNELREFWRANWGIALSVTAFAFVLLTACCLFAVFMTQVAMPAVFGR
jgi:hypothetical protein